MLLGLVLAEFAISSFASNDWLPPPSPFAQFIPPLAGVIFLPGMILILIAFADRE